MNRWRGVLVGWSTAVALSVVAWPAGAQGQTGQTPPIPVPRPFPQPNQPSSPPPSTPPSSATTPPASAPRITAQPAQSAPAPAVTPTPVANRPTERDLGVPIYPAADYLDSYDAGQGQRYYLFGTNAAFADIVTYYRNILHDSGHELFKAPAMQQFDLGKFRDDAMAYPPSVVVKDYTWALDGQRSDGYLAVNGTTEKRYKTVIQIVPAVGK
jgi:hypothetical protein